jgi:hypothetical protein
MFISRLKSPNKEKNDKKNNINYNHKTKITLFSPEEFPQVVKE